MGGTRPFILHPSHGHKKVFVGGLSWETDEKSLRDYFSNYGVVSDCVIMRDRHTGHPRGFGFVTYEDELVADHVASLRHELDGRQVEAKRAVPRSECAPTSRGVKATKKVFVGGLPATCGQEQFVKYFSRFGEIVDASVMYDQSTGNSRGFGFVTFLDEGTVDRVIECENHDIMGKFVDVKRAEPRQVLDARRREPPPVRFEQGRLNNNHVNQATAATIPRYGGLHWGLGLDGAQGQYTPEITRMVYANLYGIEADRRSMFNRPVASARGDRRYHPYRERVTRSYR